MSRGGAQLNRKAALMNGRRGLLGVLAVLAALAWLALLVIAPLYAGLVGTQVYRRAAHDKRLALRLSAVLAVELAPRLPQTDTYRWVPRQAETLQPVLETVLRPEVLEPLLARSGPLWMRWFLAQGPAPEPLTAALRAYVIEPQRPLILEALWQALPPCAEPGALYCRPDELPPAEQGYAFTALRAAWDTIEMDLYAAVDAWQARALRSAPFPWPTGRLLVWPVLAFTLTLALLALAPTHEASFWGALPLALGGLGALAVAWWLPAWAGTWTAYWGLNGLSTTVQGYALTLAQVLLEEAAWGIIAAALLSLALAGWFYLLGRTGLRRLWFVGPGLLAFVAAALLVWWAQGPAGATPQPTPTVWPSPTITLTPTPTPYWPVQPGTPVPTPMGGIALTQPPQVVGCVQAQAEPVPALALSLSEVMAVQRSATSLFTAQTLSPTAVLTHPMAAELALIPWEQQALLAAGTHARLFLLPDMTEVYTSHIPILSPIRALAVLPQRLQVLLGLDEGRIWIVDATNGDADWALWNLERHRAPITVLATHPVQP